MIFCHIKTVRIYGSSRQLRFLKFLNLQIPLTYKDQLKTLHYLLLSGILPLNILVITDQSHVLVTGSQYSTTQYDFSTVVMTYEASHRLCSYACVRLVWRLAEHVWLSLFKNQKPCPCVQKSLKVRFVQRKTQDFWTGTRLIRSNLVHSRPPAHLMSRIAHKLFI